MRSIQTLVLVLALPLGLAGCMDADGETQVLLHDTATVGEDLHTWAEPVFNQPEMEGYARRVEAAFMVTEEITRIGVSFLGDFRSPETSTSFFNITGPDGSRILTLNAEQGAEDDRGTIGSFWTFARVLDVTPGEHEVTLWGYGGVGHVSFEVRGIAADTTRYDQTFTVDQKGQDVSLDLDVRGWGETPRARLAAPDGTQRDIALDDADDKANLSVTPIAGTYRIDIDTTGWAGRIAVRVVQG